MTEEFDMEDILKQHRCSPGPEVKKAVLSQYIRRFGKEKPPSFWTMRIPLYKAVAAVILAVALSFFAGRFLHTANNLQTQEAPAQEKPVASSFEIKPVIAVNELL